ncbi:MAG: hypothetical protein IKK47_08470 [Ruminococcus sp.]|nr:hypothetical protein [Ruminococcus sp.]
MDNFSEQLVTRKETKSDKVSRIGTLITGSLFTLCLVLLGLLQLSQPVITLMFLFLAAAGGYMTYLLVQGRYVEYEYTFTNGELDIDKIIAQKKRKELLTVEVRNFSDFGKYSDDMEETEDMTVVYATDNIISNEYYADFEHKEYGRTRLIFVPDERMLENIKKFLPAKLRNSL